MTSGNLVTAIRDRIAEIDVERNQLVALLAHYENGVVSQAQSPVQPAAQGSLPFSKRPSFEKKPGGATDRVVKAVKEHPGLKYGALISKAVVGLETEAGKPRRALGSTLGSLVRRGRVVKDREGRYWPGREPVKRPGG